MNYANGYSLAANTATAVAGPFNQDQVVVCGVGNGTVWIGFDGSIGNSWSGSSNSYPVGPNETQSVVLEQGKTLYANATVATNFQVISWRPAAGEDFAKN